MFTWAFYVVKKKPFDKGVLYTVWTVSEMGLHFDLLIMPTLSCQEYSEKQGTPEAYDRIIVDTWKGLGLLPILLPLLGIVPFLFKAKYYKGLQFPPIFPLVTQPWHWLPSQSLSYNRHADSGKRGLLEMHSVLKKLIIYHGSGQRERELFSCLIKTSETHSGRTLLICTKGRDRLD